MHVPITHKKVMHESIYGLWSFNLNYIITQVQVSTTSKASKQQSEEHNPRTIREQSEIETKGNKRKRKRKQTRDIQQSYISNSIYSIQETIESIDFDIDGISIDKEWRKNGSGDGFLKDG